MKEVGQFALGIDIGGTTIKAALVDCGRGVVAGDVHTRPTAHARKPDELLCTLKILIEECDWTGATGIGFPGVVKSGVILRATHLDESWVGLDGLAHFGELSVDSFSLFNDADAAGIAEMRFGSGVDYCQEGKVVIVVTFGTGIGSAVFNGSVLLPNTELGHIEIHGMDAEEFVSARVRTEQSLSWEMWGARVCEYLQTLEKLFTPDLFIIGGGVSENFNKIATYLKTCTAVRAAKHCNTAGIIGAALVAHESRTAP